MDAYEARQLEAQIQATRVLIVDDDQYMRKVVRAMLAAVGIRTVYEASDGIAGLDVICSFQPDVVIVDWEMPMVDGAQFVRMVRSPGEFPFPDVPIIMLTGHGDRWRVLEAARLGAHEYLLKPVSTKALRDRIVSILSQPRPSVQFNGYYGPIPRRLVMLSESAGTGPAADPASAQTAQSSLAPAARRVPEAAVAPAARPVPGWRPRQAPAPDAGREPEPSPSRDVVFL